MGQFSWKSIAVIVLSVGFFVWLTQAMILSSYISSKLRIPVSIDWVSISPGHTIMYDFKIRNPRGFKSRYALWAKTAIFDYEIKSFFKNPSLIEQVTLDSIRVVIDVVEPGVLSKNNWSALSDHMSKFLRGHGVEIHQIVLTNLSVEIIEGNKYTTRTVDRVEIHNIGSKKGFPTEAVVQQIFTKSGLEMFIEGAFDPNEVLEGAFVPILF